MSSKSSYPEFVFLRQDSAGGMVVDVHVMPNAARTIIQGMHDGALRLRLKAPPVDGKANLALCIWLAEVLGIPRHSIQLLRGHTARRKQLRIAPELVPKADWRQLQVPS